MLEKRGGFTKCSCAAALAALMPTVAMAADLVEQVVNSGGGATFDRAVSPPSGAEVVAARGASNATVKASWATHYSGPRGSDRGVARISTWSLIASSPLNKNGDDTDIATLDGLVNAATLELTYSDVRAPGKRNLAKGLASAKSNAVCARVQEAMTKRQIPPRLQPNGEPDCEHDVAEHGSAVQKLEYESEFLDIANTDRWVWGGSAKIGYQNFEFIDASAVAKRKQDETPWSIGGFAAWNPDAWHALFTLRLQYQDAFKDAAVGTVCPASSGAPVTCLNGPVGRPKETKKKLISLEGRWDLGFAGVGLTSTYDAEAKVWGFELPVYFVRDEKKNLIAGVKGAWRDDTREFTASVFVGTTFGLVK